MVVVGTLNCDEARVSPYMWIVSNYVLCGYFDFHIHYYRAPVEELMYEKNDILLISISWYYEFYKKRTPEFTLH